MPLPVVPLPVVLRAGLRKLLPSRPPLSMPRLRQRLRNSGRLQLNPLRQPPSNGSNRLPKRRKLLPLSNGHPLPSRLPLRPSKRLQRLRGKVSRLLRHPQSVSQSLKETHRYRPGLSQLSK